jgi:BirA family biotin operon repressor/biotin-[acetyl-CoA-carboxylase] ligase
MRVIRLETVDSTMLECRRRLVAGEALPFVVVADQQTGGIGRLSRKWASPKGGWWFTVAVALAPGRRTLSGIDVIAIALSLAEACGGAVELGSGGSIDADDAGIRFKWPNDLMVADRKLAGVLIETLVLESRTVALVGIGVNADVEEGDLPAELRGMTIGLRTVAGKPIGESTSWMMINVVAGIVIEHLSGLNPYYVDPAVAQERLWGVGRTVPITLPDGSRVTGRIDGITDEGNLLATVNGERRTLRSVDQIG